MDQRMSHWASKTDAELLKEYSDSGSQATFAELVKRHGPMVHAVSMRVLGNHHDAQDVTQAVFLALAREAAKLTRKPSVAGWLHTVSRRLSLNARQSRESRQRREQVAMNESTNTRPDAAVSACFRRELDAALQRLPEPYRQPLVLFHLEGASLEETAGRLELHPGTLRTRLSRARGMLREILGRRGVELASVGMLTSLFAAEAKAAALPSGLLAKVLEGAGGASASPRVLDLAGQVAGASSASSSLGSIALLLKSKATLIVALTLAAVGTTVYVATRPGDEAAGQASAATEGGAATSIPRIGEGKIAVRTATDPLSRIATNQDLNALIEAVFLIETEAERLESIRRKLGMEITDEHYREAITAYYYQVDPRTVFEELLRVWARDDPEAMARWTRRFPEAVGDTLLPEALVSWLVENESAARAWALAEDVDEEIRSAAESKLEDLRAKGVAGLPQVPESSEAAAEMLHGMRTKLNALGGPEERAERNLLAQQIGTLLTRWGRKDPAAAAAFTASLDERSRLLLHGVLSTSSFLETWAQGDPDAALEWAKGIEAQERRVEALMVVLPEWQRTHPDQSVEEEVDLGEFPDHRRDALITKLVRNWSASDPAAAMDYAVGLDHPELQKELVADVMEFWVRKSPDEATGWAFEQPSGELRDIGLCKLSARISLNDFASADHMVRAIEDPGVKRQAVYEVMTHGQGMERHFDEALRLADEEMTSFEFGDLRIWGETVSREDVPAYRAWLEGIRDAGRIEFSPHLEPSVAAQRGYEFILAGLKQPVEPE